MSLLKPRFIFGATPQRLWINIMQARDDARVAAAKR